jgi:hypothetical protein
MLKPQGNLFNAVDVTHAQKFGGVPDTIRRLAVPTLAVPVIPVQKCFARRGRDCRQAG